RDSYVDIGQHAIVADSLNAGSSYTAADSLAAAVVVNGWIVRSRVYFDSLNSGVGSKIIKVPGAQPHNTIADVRPIEGYGQSGIIGAYCESPGEIIVNREATTATAYFYYVCQRSYGSGSLFSMVDGDLPEENFASGGGWMVEGLPAALMGGIAGAGAAGVMARRRREEDVA